MKLSTLIAIILLIPKTMIYSGVNVLCFIIDGSAVRTIILPKTTSCLTFQCFFQSLNFSIPVFSPPTSILPSHLNSALSHVTFSKVLLLMNRRINITITTMRMHPLLRRHHHQSKNSTALNNFSKNSTLSSSSSRF